ncbi:MAG: ATP-binding cassette domain-containing protein [Flavobacteriales bacterium]|nr:ATP-binding cassette domain-containing protein [Flavobacteriales bacterium]MCB9194327.1 ATP-binding cassette domain-containing protein [Flavobacteriales bacterium]
MASRRSRSADDAPVPKVSRAALRRSLRIFRYLRPYRWTFALGLLFLFGTSLLSMAFPVLMGKLVDASSGTRMPHVRALDLTNIDSVALVLVVIFAVQAVLGFFRIYLFSYVTENALARVRQETYQHLLRLPMTYFAGRRVGELNSRISADVALLQESFTTVLAELVRQVIVIITGMFLLTRVSLQLTLTMLATIPIVALVAVFFGRFIRRLSKQVQDKIADTNVIVDETLQGIQNVKAFANEAWEAARYRMSVLGARDLALVGARWRGGFVSFIIFCMFGAVVLVVWRGVHLKEQGLLTVGDLTSFIMLSVFVGASIGSVPELVSSMLKAVGATERLLDIQEERMEDIDLARTRDQLDLNGEIAFGRVCFHYASRPDLQVLHDVTFTIRSGERVALVGPSGAGKSTIASLVLRFYEPTQGHVLIDGRDVQEYPLSALRDRMAIVPQEVLLFGGSIRENIAYGRPGASDDEVREAARKANALEFIQGFPMGFDTVVGERGVQLSGGQRQRIAIARAVIKDPAILILDEATSSLDTASERLVQEALEGLMKGRTSLVIAHRLSTVQSADRILVLDRGYLVESGTHDELIANEQGLYHSLSQLQFGAVKA